MANRLDETTGPVNHGGREIHVIDKQLPVTVGFGSTLFEIMLWLLGIIPGLIFLFMKISAKTYFLKLEQKLQAEASEIDNYIVQRAQILFTLKTQVDRAVQLDSDVMKSVSAFRGGAALANDATRNTVSAQLDTAFGRLFPQVEAYPDLKAHQAIAEAIRQNSYLQREITAARSLYNSTVSQWNRDIHSWPTMMIVAAREGYTTRIPFTASAADRAAAQNFSF